MSGPSRTSRAWTIARAPLAAAYWTSRDFFRPLSLWLPDDLVPSTWHEHAPFAFWLMEVAKPRLVVELGTHHGFSYLVFCQAIRRLALDATAFAVDTWQGDE